MDLYLGGSYNGKLKYVKSTLNIGDGDIFYCIGSDIDFSKKVISGIHIFIYNQVLKNRNPIKYLQDNIDKMKNCTIICDDLSSGIVPLKKEDRIWREETGKVLQFLSENSSKVVRIFCGIPQVLKDE